MSFASEARAELCRLRIDRQCCAVAECCGVLLYSTVFSRERVRISTASPEFAARLPKLFSKAFALTFDGLPPAYAAGEKTPQCRGESSGPAFSGAEAGCRPGRYTFTVTDRDKLQRIFETFGLDFLSPTPVHVNFALLEEECCRIALIRGAFLAGGSVTDPVKGTHLELSTPHRAAARETCSILQELDFQPGESQRAGHTLLYFKQSDKIADFLTTIGAGVTAMGVMTARVDKEMRNRITRQINCDSANADRTVTASREQIDAIRRVSAKFGGLDALPEGLRDAALLRITNPEASLADLSKLSFPPVSKSCLSHRLNRILALAAEEELPKKSADCL